MSIRAAASETFRSLSVRNFRLFFVGQLISQVGNWVTMIAQTLLVLHLGGSGLDIGILVACQFVPVLVLGAWSGLVADRSDKRRLLMVTQAAAMAQSCALAALAFSGDPPLWAIDAVALVGGVCLAFDNPARRALVVEMVPEDHVNNAVSLNSALMTSARVFGPALAGLLVHTVGYGWCFAADAVSYVAVLVALYRIDPDALRRAPVTARAKGQIRAGFRYVLTVPDLWIPLVVMTIVGTLTFNFTVVFPLFVIDTLGGSDATFTTMFSVLSFGSLVGALVTARRSVVTGHHVLSAAAAFGVSMALLAFAPSLPWTFPLGLLVGGASVAFLTSSTSIVQLRADPSMRGRVLALQAIVFLGSTPIGGPILGAICDAFGARAGVLVGGAAALAAAAWGRAAFARIDDAAALSAAPAA